MFLRNTASGKQPQHQISVTQRSDSDGLAEAAHSEFAQHECGTEQETDMTPMVDVTFLLLIFFMVTATFNLQKAIVVPKPDSYGRSAPPLAAETLTIHVDEFNTFLVEIRDDKREAASEHELYRQVRRLATAAAKSSRPTTLVVVANEEARHGKVVAALDAGMSVGMERIQLRTVDE